MSETSENKGVTIRELKTFLNRLPEKFDDFGMVNGEVTSLEDEYYARIDKPIIHLEIDEETGEFLLLHQSEDELNEIMDKINGNPEGTE
jgi:hypothetical protein